MADLVPEHGVGAEGVEVHVSRHTDQLGPGEVVEGEVVFEDLADFYNVGWSGGFACGADL